MYHIYIYIYIFIYFVKYLNIYFVDDRIHIHFTFLMIQFLDDQLIIRFELVFCLLIDLFDLQVIK